MGFYKHKLQEYKKNFQPLSLEERMLQAKERTIEIMQEQYAQDLAKYRAFATSSNGVNFSAQLMGAMQHQLNVLDAQIQQTQEMPVEDFYIDLISKESESLNSYITSKDKEMSGQMRTIGSIGVSSPFVTFWYGEDFARSMEERAEALHDSALLNSAYEHEASVAKTEWEEFSDAEKVEYLVGRVENESLIKFDQMGLDAMGQTKFETFEGAGQEDGGKIKP